MCWLVVQMQGNVPSQGEEVLPTLDCAGLHHALPSPWQLEAVSQRSHSTLQPSMAGNYQWQPDFGALAHPHSHHPCQV